MRMSFALAVSLLALALGAVAPEGSGPQDLYLGQALPGSKPEVFAPGIVSTDGHEFACSFTPDGRFLFFSGGKPPAGDIYWVSASVLGAGVGRD